MTEYFASLILILAASIPFSSQSSQPAPGSTAQQHATGSFDVKVSPLPAYDTGPAAGKGTAITHMSADKQFHGDLEATSKGEMLAAGSGAPGSSGAYVALERVSGKLNGRSGTFILQHSATMTRGTPQLTITVVPDSGTDGLTGLTGKMNIRIEAGGKHFYDFDYTLPTSQ